MKICFVINTLSTGGAERVAARLSSCWADNNDVTLVLTSFSKRQDYKISERINVINTCEKKRINRFSLIRKLRKIFKEIKPDVIVSFIDTGHFYVSLANRHLKFKHVCSERNDPYTIPKSKLQRLMRLFAFRRADAVVFQTEGAMQFFNKRIQKKGVIIENPITNNFVPTDCSYRKNQIIAVGRLVEQKNYPLLIKAFSIFHKDYPQYSLLIFGRGEKEKEIMDLIRELGLEQFVFVKGFSSDISDELKKSKIFAMSSVHEGLPNSLIEAVCAGIPCVSTNARPGGPMQILKNYQGSMLIKDDSTESFSNGLSQIASNYDKFCNNAIVDSAEARKRFSIERISDSWMKLFKELSND